MKNRIISILLLSFMMVSLVVPVAPIYGANNNFKTESITVQEELREDQGIIVYEFMQNITKIKSDIDIAIKNMNIEMSEIENITNKKEWFIAYKEVINRYSYILDSPETIYDYFTDEEIYLIQRCVETETYEADFNAKCNVASVIFNRIFYSGNYYPEFIGKTVKEIIETDNQFAYGRTEISEDTILAVEYTFAIEDTTDGALFFHSNPKTKTWYGSDWLFEDSVGHHFYGIREN